MIQKTHTKIIHSTLKNCFKTPIYGDVRKIMTGYLILPASEGVTDDNSWANPMGKRIVIAFGKPLCTEQIVVREENMYWKYELVNFQQSSFFFTNKVTGEIKVSIIKFCVRSG